MSRMGVTIAVLILIAGMLMVALITDLATRRASAPAGPTSQITPTTAYDLQTRQPKPDAFYALQWLADGVRCPVTDNVSLMASCILQRYGKMRDKALSARARYDALVGLERAYWAALAREGLTQRVEHVPTGAVP